MKRYLVMTCDTILSGPTGFVSRYRVKPPEYRRDLVNRWPQPALHWMGGISARDRRVGQISPDRNVNCDYTTAAFTLSLEPWASYMSCRLTRRLGLVCYFCSSAHSLALRLPSNGSLRSRPCLRLVLVQLCKSTLAGFTYRGLAPHKFTPTPGVHERIKRTPNHAGKYVVSAGSSLAAWFGAAYPGR